jgi:hypothetical protein
VIIHDNFQFHHPVVSEKKIFKNFRQSEAIMSPGSHVGKLIGRKVTPLEQTMQRNIPTKCDPICFSDSLKKIEISTNQRFVWSLAVMLDDRSEQKVTTLDKDLARNISAKNGSNPSSGS